MEEPQEKTPESQRSLSPQEKANQQAAESRSGMRWMGYGVEFAGVIGLFSWLGYLADEKFQTGGPWWTITGFFLAFVGMVYLLLKETGVIPTRKAPDKEER